MPLLVAGRWTVECQQFTEPGPATGRTRSDCADRYVEGHCHLLVTESRPRQEEPDVPMSAIERVERVADAIGLDTCKGHCATSSSGSANWERCALSSRFNRRTSDR